MLVIFKQFLSVSIDEKWSVFLESSKKGGAARPTIEPDKYWIRNISVLEVILRLDKQIMKPLGFSNIKVS